MPVTSEPWNFGAAGPQAATASTSSAASVARRKCIREPLNKSRTVATAAFRDGMREARRRQWQVPLASLATKQTARKAPSLRVAAKCGACFVALFGIIAQATTFVARLAFIRILPATQSAWDLFRGSLGSLAQQRRHPGTLFLQLLEGGVHPLARERVDLEPLHKLVFAVRGRNR